MFWEPLAFIKHPFVTAGIQKHELVEHVVDSLGTTHSVGQVVEREIGHAYPCFVLSNLDL